MLLKSAAARLKAKSGGNIEIANLSTKQLDRLQQSMGTGPKDTNDKTTDTKQSKSKLIHPSIPQRPKYHRPMRRKHTHITYQHWRDGIAPHVHCKDTDIQFWNLGYPNYPDDPQAKRMEVIRKEFPKPRMHKNYFKGQVPIQFAPFRRTMYHIAFNSQTMLPKPMVETAKSEFISLSKGNARRVYKTGQKEPVFKN